MTRDGDLSPRKAVTPSVSVGRVFLVFHSGGAALWARFSPLQVSRIGDSCWHGGRELSFLSVREGVLSRLNSVCRGASRGHLRSSFYWAVERKSQQTEARTSRSHRKSHYMCGSEWDGRPTSAVLRCRFCHLTFRAFSVGLAFTSTSAMRVSDTRLRALFHVGRWPASLHGPLEIRCESACQEKK